ncbi:MAG: WbqC family protein [Cyclobacteriaceae bacterium]|nr:WbqC family protein [Cyclobacteriaceae bacterium]
MKTALIEAHYLPSVAYFSALQTFDEVMLERHENFVKQSYRNRCYINTSNGTEMLIIPLTQKHGKVLITDIRIDYSQKWLNNHWRTIQSAYGNAPFFEYYEHDLHQLLFRKFETLYELNLHLLTLCLRWLKWTIPVKESLAYNKEVLSPMVDLRSAINPKKTHHLDHFYKPVPYQQVFGNMFVPGLSVLDLVFCQGPESGRILRASSPG